MTEFDQARYRNYRHYLDEAWPAAPKANFRRVAEAAAALGLREARVLDVGCAAGELIVHLAGGFPRWSFLGIDPAPPLIEEARRQAPGADFLCEGLLQLDASHDSAYDLITAVGVLSLFEDEELARFWAQLHALLRPGGTALVLGPLNEFGVDLMLRHRKWAGDTRGDWERGWSIPSRRTVEAELAARFAAWEIAACPPELDLAPQEDPVRTWTVVHDGRPRQLTNGLKLLVDHYLIRAQR